MRHRVGTHTQERETLAGHGHEGQQLPHLYLEYTSYAPGLVRLIVRVPTTNESTKGY